MYVSTFSIRSLLACSCGVPGSTLLTCGSFPSEHYKGSYRVCSYAPFSKLAEGIKGQQLCRLLVSRKHSSAYIMAGGISICIWDMPGASHI